MRVSITISKYASEGAPTGLGAWLAEIAHGADEAGVDTIWVPDHLIQVPEHKVGELDGILEGDPFGAPKPMLEAYVTLGFVAAQTQRVRLGTMVTAVTFRPPSLLLKAVTTLDVLSGGRAWLGIGAGYYEEEARAMGLLLPPTAERFERLEETLHLALRMWRGDSSPFGGDHYQLEHPLNVPAALTRPRPPILIGGMGERKTLRLVAQYADACNLFEMPDGGETVRHKLRVIAGHCESVGRPYEEIEKTVSTGFDPKESQEQFVEHATQLAALGLDHVNVYTPSPWTAAAIASLGPAIAAVQDIAPASRSSESLGRDRANGVDPALQKTI